MGYTAIEARRGLRSAQGNVDQAIEFIIEVTTHEICAEHFPFDVQNRRLREERHREEEVREEEERLQNRYGRTQNGQKSVLSNAVVPFTHTHTNVCFQNQHHLLASARIDGLSTTRVRRSTETSEQSIGRGE